MQPKISVIVPVFNAEKYLKRCIDSVLAQSVSDFELILVDDGSKDNSGKICDDYVKQDSRVIVYHKPNGGVSSARNFGLDKAKGDWIVFVDSDDWVGADYCANMLAFATSPLSFVMTRHDFVGKQVNSIVECHNLVGKQRIDYIILNKLLDFSGPYCKLFNRGVIEENKIRFPENIHMGEDGIFMVKYLNVTEALTVLNINDYHYQDIEQSLSHRFYDFQSEYECYRLWKREIEILFSARYWEQEEDKNNYIWANRIGDTFMRCILCLSRQTKILTTRQIYNHLKSIHSNDWEEFERFYRPTTTQRRIIKIIFKLHSLALDTKVIQVDRMINKSGKKTI